jgi:hypothetical protein
MSRSFRRHVRGALGGEYEIVRPQDWQAGADKQSRLGDYVVLDLWEAKIALADIARTRQGTELLRDVAQEILPHFHSVSPRTHSYGRRAEDAQRLEELEKALGSFPGERGAPPRFARFYVCQRKPRASTREALPDPWKNTNEAVEAAKAAPRGYVTVEAVTETDEPVPYLRLEVLLADGEVISRSTDGQGRLHLEPIPQGRCTVRVTALDGTAWRPSTGSSSPVDKQHKQTHVVQQGERLGRIARQHGFYDWKMLWGAPENDALRAKRKEPQWIRPGDEVVIPGVQIHQVVWPTDQSHRIVLSERPDEASVFVVTPYTQADVDNGLDAELSLSGSGYSQTLTLSANRAPVSDYFDVHYVEVEFKNVPTNGRYVLKIKPESGEEHTVFEDVPFEELMDDAHLDGSAGGRPSG